MITNHSKQENWIIKNSESPRFLIYPNPSFQLSKKPPGRPWKGVRGTPRALPWEDCFLEASQRRCAFLALRRNCFSKHKMRRCVRITRVWIWICLDHVKKVLKIKSTFCWIHLISAAARAHRRCIALVVSTSKQCCLCLAILTDNSKQRLYRTRVSNQAIWGISYFFQSLMHLNWYRVSSINKYQQYRWDSLS